MSSLRLTAVGKNFGELEALVDVTLEFPESRITAVIGRSGCGKSTLLKVCNGLVIPDCGRVDVLGAPLSPDRLPTLRHRIGYAVQGTGLFPHMTIERNITLLAVLLGWERNRIRDRVDELLTLTHLDRDLLSRYPHQLSGGQQQRVGLCRAMLLRPAILLLDEPFAAIDPITRADIHRELLALLAAEPTTTVLVTHDIREALLLADYIVLMDAGRVRLQSDTDALLAMHRGKNPDELLDAIAGGNP